MHICTMPKCFVLKFATSRHWTLVVVTSHGLTDCWTGVNGAGILPVDRQCVWQVRLTALDRHSEALRLGWCPQQFSQKDKAAQVELLGPERLQATSTKGYCMVRSYRCISINIVLSSIDLHCPLSDIYALTTCISVDATLYQQYLPFPLTISHLTYECSIIL